MTPGRLCLPAVLLSALVVTGACSKPNPDEHLRKGNAYLADSKLAEAILEYRMALQTAPMRGDIREKLSEAYLRNGEPSNALKEAVRAADIRKDDPLAQLRAGNLLVTAGAFQEAKTRAESVLALDPKSADGLVLLGNALAGLKDMDGAVAEYEEAVALNPGNASAYSSLGVLQLAKGQRADAEASFRKAVEVAPKSVPARMALANFLWSTDRRADAEKTLKDALAIDPNNLALNRALGVFYIVLGRVAEAEPYFQTIAKVGGPKAGLILADYYVGSRRLDAAETVLKGMTSKPETSVDATIRLAAIFAERGRRADAIAMLQELLTKQPKEARARIVRARLLLVDGKREEALREASAVVKDEPNSPLSASAYLEIGDVQASLDLTDQAIVSYEEALKRQPQWVTANLGLAGLYLRQGAFDKAATHAEGALAAQPGNPDARAMIVRILLARGDLAAASQALASLQKDFPDSPVVIKLIAARQTAEKQLDAARASYAKAAERTSHDLEALAGLVSIDLAAGKKQAAIDRIEASLKTWEPTSGLFVLAARTYDEAGDAAKSEELLKRAIEADPARLQAYTLLGGLYVRQRRLDDAMNQYKRIVERDPRSISANTMLGMLLEAQQRLPEAEQQYQKVLGLDSRAAVAANNLAWMYVAGNRNIDQALQLAQVAKQALPDEPHVSDTLGWIYYRKNLSFDAVQHLESSVQHDASDPTTHYHLGMAYVQAGNLDKAKRELRRALAFKTEFDGADEARKTLAQLGS